MGAGAAMLGMGAANLAANLYSAHKQNKAAKKAAEQQAAAAAEANRIAQRQATASAMANNQANKATVNANSILAGVTARAQNNYLTTPWGITGLDSQETTLLGG